MIRQIAAEMTGIPMTWIDVNQEEWGGMVDGLVVSRR